MYSLRPLIEPDLELVLDWRNKPEIRKNMYTNHVISLEEHKQWFERIRHDKTKQYFICEADRKPIGVVNFVDVNKDTGTASWGFYSGDLTRRGTGTQMEFLALEYAFKELGLRKLSCEVLATNVAVISLHRKFGFRLEGTFAQQHFDGEGYVDIVRLAMFNRDWLKYQSAYFSEFLSAASSKSKGRLDAGQIFREKISVSQDDINRFSELTGDLNPVHFDSKAAISQGFDGPIAHGFLLGSAFSKVLGTQFPGNGTIYTKQSLNFRLPAYPDETYDLTLKVLTRIGRRLVIETTISNQKGQTVIHGEAEVLVSGVE